MSAEEFIQYLSWIIYSLIFIAALSKAIRFPRRTNIDIVLFFGVTTIIIILALFSSTLHYVQPTTLTAEVNGALLISLSYLIVRLLDDFAAVPSWLMRAAEVLLLLLWVGIFALRSDGAQPYPGWYVLLALLYLAGLQVYAAVAFVRAARRSSGVTRRRMWAVAMGSLFLALNFLTPQLDPGNPTLRATATFIGLLSGLSYFVGFAPPQLLRRAWQEPELREFLSRAARLPRLPDTQTIVAELEEGAAHSLGAPNARLALWDEHEKVLRLRQPDQDISFVPGEDTLTGRAFLRQQPAFGANLSYDNDSYTNLSRRYGVGALMVAPITAGERRLGMLCVYGAQAPIFAEDDLALVQLLADQAAVVLESRALIDEATRVRAREEATRLKDDFLSAAAHDLKSPLTALIAQAQLLERRALRNPQAPADLNGIRQMIKDIERLMSLVLELLDAARAEQGKLVGAREEVDLVELAREVCDHQRSVRHRIVLQAEESVVGGYDRSRIAQLLENLVENAVKYSPEGGEVRLAIWQEPGQAHLEVRDQGIGIPPADLPLIFERFYRANNVDDRRFAGMGLGLFICRGIVEQHGGTIRASSVEGRGTTFHVILPLTANGGSGNATSDSHR